MPESSTFQPAASIWARSSSAVAQSRSRRATARASARARTSSGGLVAGHAPEDTAGQAVPAAPAAITASDRIQVWASPLHSTEPGPPVQPAVDQPAAERAQRLHLGLAQVGERERERRDTTANGPITRSSANSRNPR